MALRTFISPPTSAVICLKSWSGPDKISTNYLVVSSTEDLLGQLHKF